jgi:BirA family transcriptional regulator, biotin operon repressor / biotin---[acetyl-CoA-carboxylase] ligase
MSKLTHPAVLTHLGQVGDMGLAVRADPQFQDEVGQCRRWGFKIRSSGDRISLIFDHEQLVPQWIEKETPPIAWERLWAKGFLRLQSTNTEARILAEQGAPGGTLVFAEEQTAGRGRQDRAWHSPAGTSLYCTLIVRPRQARKSWPLLTHVASIALVEAIKELAEHNIIAFPLDTDIKWPNDVLLSGKKCAGLLLEALWDNGANDAALVGFGINVHKGSVPGELTGEGACLDEMAHTVVPRRKLLVLYLKHFQICYLMYEQGRYREVLDQWKLNSSMWNGAPIYIGKGEARREAVTCGLNDLGALMVRTSDGKLETLFAEDVSISRKRL